MFSYYHRSRWFYMCIVIFVLLILSLAACDSGNQVQQLRPTPTTSPWSQLVPFDIGIPKAALNSPTVGTLPDNTPMHVLVTFKSNQALLNKLDSQKAGAGSGTDIASLANQFGITDQQYQQIKKFFGVQGASLKLGKLHTNLAIDAQAGTFAKLLHTHFVYHQYQGRKFFAPATLPQLPKPIVDNTVAITGLDNYTLPPAPHVALSDLQPIKTQVKRGANARCVVSANNMILPQQVARAYGFAQLYKQGWTGLGLTIILPEWGAFNVNDVRYYLSCVGYRGKLTYVNVDNVPPTDTTGNGSIEATMDIELVAGLTPDANIEVYQTSADNRLPDGTPTNSFHDVFNQIIADNTNNQSPKVISLSWGSAETYNTQSSITTIDNDIQYLTRAEHITYFASSGDCGAYSGAYEGGGTSVRTVDFPASDPQAIGVGGTQLTVDSAGDRLGEVVWSSRPKSSTCRNDWGSGGGLSQYFQRPSWQTGNGIQNSYSSGARQVPDLSAVATSLAIFVQGRWYYGGGTSAATPIWATGFALVNQGLVQNTHYFLFGPHCLYAAAGESSPSLHPYYDVQRGTNLYYPATAGWDYASGLGTPNLGDLYQAMHSYLESIV